MKKTILTGILFSMLAGVSAQNSAEKIIGSNEGLHIGGYGQIDFNLPSRDGSIHRNGVLDVHRFVTFFGDSRNPMQYSRVGHTPQISHGEILAYTP